MILFVRSSFIKSSFFTILQQELQFGKKSALLFYTAKKKTVGFIKNALGKYVSRYVITTPCFILHLKSEAARGKGGS